jgi:hypothetical protein
MENARRLATYTDLLALPEGTRAEVLDGVMTLPPAPLPRHARAQRALGRFLGGPFDDDDGRGGPGGSWILAEVDVRLSPHDIVRPDGSDRARSEAPLSARSYEMRSSATGPRFDASLLTARLAATLLTVKPFL